MWRKQSHVDDKLGSQFEISVFKSVSGIEEFK